jgi:hypothetical protein
VLFVASIVLLRRHRSGGTAAAEIHDFYLRKDASSVARVRVYLAPFSGIAFVWFIAAVRNLIGDREARLLATVCLGRGPLFAPMPFAAAGMRGAPLVAVTSPDEPAPSAETVALPDVVTVG